MTDHSPARTPHRASLGLALILAILGMVGPFTIDTPFPAFAQMRTEFGVDAAALQQVVSVYLIAFAVMSLFHGPISDAVGRRPVLIGSGVVYALASIACALSPNLTWLLVFRAVQGASAGGSAIVSRTVVTDLFRGPAAQRLMSLIMVIFGIAPAMAPVIGGWLLLIGPWQGIFWFLAAFGLLAATLVLFRLPESLPPQDRHPFHPGSILGQVLLVARDWRFQRVAWASALSFSAQILYVVAAPIFIVDILGKGEQDFWMFFVPMVGGMVLGSFLNGRLSEVWSPHRVVLTGQVVGLIAAVLNVGLASLPATAAQLPWAVIGPVGIGFGTGMAFPIFQLVILNMFPHSRGAASSMASFIQIILMAVLAGLVVPVVTGSALTLALTSLVFLVVGQSLWQWHVWSERSRPRTPTPARPTTERP
ncbi:multidrug effflux MFS transporter [Kribbia dieselivorans]|uniref:multidrug effflux MFS transporter n=1 Tax=Kribbia dieselivorans TaxID=331526 RepID=UPI001FDF605E|nr:multidrug effflux MFS transporter [Kribbia dieselivorans]